MIKGAQRYRDKREQGGKICAIYAAIPHYFARFFSVFCPQLCRISAVIRLIISEPDGNMLLPKGGTLWGVRKKGECDHE